MRARIGAGWGSHGLLARRGTAAGRGQVLVAERWAAEHPGVPVAACHPGWTLTDGVEAAYGDRCQAGRGG